MRKTACKFITIILILACLTPVYADSIDLSAMSLEELLAHQKDVASAITKKTQELDSDGYTLVSDYEDYARNPEAHDGESIRFNGKVIQVSEGDEITYRIAFKNDSDSVFYVTYTNDGNSRVLEDDKVTVWGICTGVYSYTSVLGGLITIPACKATKITEQIAENTEYAATRTDPAPIGATVRYNAESYSNPAITDLTVTNVIRGEAAYKIVKSYYRYSDKPDKGKEWLLVYINTKAISSKDDKPASIDDYDFTFVSQNGVQIEKEGVYGNDQKLMDIYPGAENEGLTGTIVNANEDVYLVYLASSDTPIWFDLNNHVPVVYDPEMIVTPLKKGDKGQDVVRMQQMLIQLGYLSGSADGDYGNMTQTAIIKYQSDLGLEQTGDADEETIRRVLQGVTK